MLQMRIVVIDFGTVYSLVSIIKRLNAIGYVSNARIPAGHRIIYFEYATFRDVDAALMELRNMGVICKECKSGSLGKTTTGRIDS